MQHESEPFFPSTTLPLMEKSSGSSVPRIVSSAPPPVHNTTPASAPPPVLVGPENTVTTCPFCQASIRTAVRHTVTTLTHITSVLCCAFCCCCLPYCMDSTRNSDHYCPACQRYLGTYRK